MSPFSDRIESFVSHLRAFMISYSALQQGLRQYFGYSDFRKRQRPLVELVASGENCLGIMQTGGGKSICFQLPALLSPGITIVVSPLISLINDQVRELKSASLPAEAITSETSFPDRQRIMQSLRNGGTKLLYVAPELFCQSQFIRQFDNDCPLSRVVFDEAHCLSQWGEDFRPGYLRAAMTLKHLTEVYQRHSIAIPQIVAVTASATPLIQKQLCSLLNISAENLVAESLMRENLLIEIHNVGDKEDRKKALLNLLNLHRSEPVVIYTNSRREVDSLYQFIRISGYTAGRYHAGMDKGARAESQSEFLSDKITVMVATTAFGMGINKPNIRAVIHYKLPRTIEDYYQQAGRAGRDDEPAYAHVLFNNHHEFNSLNSMLNYSHPISTEVKACYEFLLALQRAQVDTPVDYPVSVISKSLGINEAKIKWSLQFLERQRIIIPEGKGYFVLQLKKANWKHVDKIYSHRSEKASLAMKFAQTDQCRQQYILSYFGEKNPSLCGICDNCRQTKALGTRENKDISQAILRSELREACKKISRTLRVPVAAILTEESIASLSKKPPETEEALRKITGMSAIQFSIVGKPLLQTFSMHGYPLGSDTDKSQGAQSMAPASTSLGGDDALFGSRA